MKHRFSNAKQITYHLLKINEKICIKYHQLTYPSIPVHQK